MIGVVADRAWLLDWVANCSEEEELPPEMIESLAANVATTAVGTGL